MYKCTIYTYIQEHNYKEVKKLIINGLDVNTRNVRGITLLMFAAGHGDFKIVRLLLENGADVNLYDDQKRTALMLAIILGYHKVVKELLLYNPDLYFKDNNETALLLLSQHPYKKIVKMMIKKTSILIFFSL